MNSEIKVYTNAKGKMEGTHHISCASGQSGICHGCLMNHVCYALRYQKLRPSVKQSYWHNGEVLTSRVFDMSELPYVNAMQCRFNAFGELLVGKKGEIQLTNYVNICRKNPRVHFALWSRNYKLVEDYFKMHGKPSNLKIIMSAPNINAAITKADPIWDGIFNVVTPEYAEKHNLTINCGALDDEGKKIPCIRCPTGCYNPGTRPMCYELVK